MNVSMLQAFRWAAVAEGVSYIALLLGMMLKYGVDMPMAVTVTGQIHGYLVIVYLALMVVSWIQLRWSIGRVLVLIFWLLVPIGGFIVARRIEREAHEETIVAA